MSNMSESSLSKDEPFEAPQPEELKLEEIKIITERIEAASLKYKPDTDAAKPQIVNKVSSKETVTTDNLEDNGLSKEILEDIQDVFNLFDEDKSGTISIKELGRVMRALGQSPTEAELLDIMALADVDGSGEIDFVEFVDVIKDIIKESDDEDDIRGAFGVFDQQGKGFITVHDLENIFSSLGEKIRDEEYDDMITAADMDGDGVVTVQDLIEMMKNRQSE